MRKVYRFLVTVGCCVACAQAAVRYTLTDLSATGLSNVDPADINNLGQVVGTHRTGSVQRVFVYQSGQMTDLGTFGGTGASANGVNNHGQIVGYRWTGGRSGPCRFGLDGEVTELGIPDGYYGTAYGISDAGQIVGYASVEPTPTRIFHAFSYQEGHMADLGTLGGATSVAYAVNNRGQAAGQSGTPDGSTRACVFEPDGTIRNVAGSVASTARDINDSGLIVGSAQFGPPHSGFHAFLCDGSNPLKDLGILADDYSYSYAYSINNRGQIVGEAAVGVQLYHAFIYEGDQMLDLNDLIDPGSGWELKEAVAINDLGQIIGSGIRDGQSGQAFLLTPIPEPTTLLCLTAAAIAAIQRRQSLRSRRSSGLFLVGNPAGHAEGPA